ncbi:hypothetical protein [Kibdelosporangium aridum]|uniref:hypothetical protein n=1 Tax=Kibdelosporangium aridum TaxID=2030 RepID=UPI0037C0B6C0
MVAGDFNASPDAASVRFLAGQQSLGGRSVCYHDAWAIGSDGPGYTWSVDNPNARLEIEGVVRQPEHRRRVDYVLVGSWDAHPAPIAGSTGLASRSIDHPVGSGRAIISACSPTSTSAVHLGNDIHVAEDSGQQEGQVCRFLWRKVRRRRSGQVLMTSSAVSQPRWAVPTP